MSEMRCGTKTNFGQRQACRTGPSTLALNSNHSPAPRNKNKQRKETIKTNVLLKTACIGLAVVSATFAADDKKHEEHTTQSPMAAEIARKSGAEFEGVIEMGKLAAEKAQ